MNIKQLWTDIGAFVAVDTGKVVSVYYISASLISGMFWALYQQCAGAMPTISSLFGFALPFAVNRSCDILMGPLFWLVSYALWIRYQRCVDVGEWNYASEEEDDAGIFGNILIIVIFLSSIAGFLFGFPYAILCIPVLFVVCLIALFLVAVHEGIRLWQSRKHEGP
jgi:hypothetical protein